MSVASAILLLTTNQPTKGNKMARQNKSLSVKVATVKVIKALEVKLAQVEKDYASQEANEAKFDKAQEKWQKEIFAIALTLKAKATNVRVANKSYSDTINIDFDIPKGSFVFPAEPEKDFEVVSKWNYKETKEELENALRILKMTDEELVSASTFGSIAKYL